LRSTESASLALVGIVDGRRACVELPDIEDGEAMEGRLAGLREEVESAPSDDANAVSSAPMRNDRARTAARDLTSFATRGIRCWISVAAGPGKRLSTSALSHIGGVNGER
jgi:hypothetical protein